MKALEFKSFDFESKQEDDSGNLIITGYAATFGNIDSYKDTIERQAFESTIMKRGERIAFCYQHDIWNPIGKILKLSEDQKGLFIKVMISAAEEDIQTKIKEGILKEMSIGYRVIASRNEVKDGEEIRVLEEIELFEISIVTVAADSFAKIEGMKGEESINYLEKEFNRLIALVKNENVNFEIRKLKELTVSVLAQKSEPPKEVEEMKAERILELLNFKN